VIYLLGGNGYVGQAYQALFARQGIAYRAPSRAEIPLNDPAALTAALKTDQAAFLINAAGYTGKPNVDACELHKTECLFGNAVLPGIIAQACAEAGVPWGHISSGCIYTGARPDGSGFTEYDAPNFDFRHNNCSWYSGCKALGEEVLASQQNLYIWRLRIPFDNRDSDRNYLTKLRKYKRLLDVRNSISQLDEFVAATFACWGKRVPFGIYNVTNPGSVTTREVVDLMCKSGVLDHEPEYFADEADFMSSGVARAPRSSCVLDSSKLVNAGIHMTEVHEAIERDLANWQSV
jgi:dTDP-4-dehydrorhamnose reductase